MASIYSLKPRFQSLLRPLAKTLRHFSVSPNQVTITAILLSFAMGLLIYFYPTSSIMMLLLPLTLFLRMVLNAIDGMMAHEFHLQSNLGTFLNELGDVISDTFLYLPFAFVPGFNPTLIITIVLLAILTEMTGVVAVMVNSSRRYDGPMGKSDRAFVFGLIAFLIGIKINIIPWMNYILWIVIALLVLTIINRIKKALQ